jgi:cell fate (sporulation/competence/biofilm development) regulator YlbF (YheA/YmcA/DUF963 family)
MGMRTEVLRDAALSFARSLKSADVVKQFLEAQHVFENDANLSRSRAVFNEAAQSFQKKQSAGTISEQDINRMRTLQSNVNLHPHTVELLRSQQEIAELLQQCNQQISEVLGLDFSAIAVPPGCC